jgi:hypothetical protein
MKFPATILFAISFVLPLAADSPGLRPRANATDYPARTAQNGILVAADPLDTDQVKRSFATDIYDGYLVVEVAVYPASSQALNISDMDFALRLNGYSSPIRPATPRAIAAALHRSKQPKQRSASDIAIYPSVGIGYESGSGGYNPNEPYGRNHRGIYTTTGVTVAGGDAGPVGTPPGSSGADRRTMESELSDKSLPEGRVDAPVAGYLYFPLPGKKRLVPQSLEFDSSAGLVKVVFPPARKK